MDFGSVSPAGAMGGVGSIFSFIGNMAAGNAAKQAGQRQAEADQFAAAQYRQQALQTEASSQRDAGEQLRRGRIIASRAQAVAAASGGGVSDPTISHLLADIEGEGAYRAGVALYQGDERARQLRMDADAKVFEASVAEEGGKQRQTAYELAGFGRLASGSASLYGKYGMGGPKKSGVGSAAGGGGSWTDAGTEGYSTFG